VGTADAVARAAPRPDVFLKLGVAEPTKAYVFFDEGDTTRRVTARFFFPSSAGVIEDPATGSACANLGGWFSVIQPRIPIARSVSQGEAVKRPSTLFLNVEWQESNPRIFVGGDVIELGRGTLDL
jgi:trans-2,3-dihydro-3-hydroxyanthranilate isomerase